MRRSTLEFLLAVSIAAAAPAGADSFLDRGYGTPVAGLSPRARAMGGAAAALGHGAYGLVDNPATLVLVRGSRVQAAGAVARASENRFVPLYDTFGSYVSEAAVATNDHGYPSLNGGIVVDRLDREGVVLAAGVFERYDYFDERRSTANTDDIVAERTIRSRGVLRSATFGVARPAGPAALGAALNLYAGRWTDRDALVARLASATSSDTSLERRLSGVTLTVGGALAVGERVGLGLAFETAPRLRNRYARTEDGAIVTPPGASNHLRLPWRLQGGASYRPRNAFRTTVAADVVYMPWSEVEDPLAPALDLRDTWDVRFGLEHVYYNALPGRIGFRYTRSYAARDADRAAFTFGVGYRVEGVRLDLAGELAKRTSRQDPLIPRAVVGPYAGAGADRVEDTLVRVSVGAEFDF